MTTTSTPLTLQTLPKIKTQGRKRVGRGIGSSKGKTSGRGVKGQKARTGHHSVKGFEGGQTPIYMRLPKRGFVNIFRKSYQVVNIRDISRHVEINDIDPSQVITKETLKTFGLIDDQNAKVKLIMSHDNFACLPLKIAVDSYSAKSKAFSVE